MATTNPPADQSTDTTSQSILHPEKPTPYIHDAGHLLITDPNPLPSSSQPGHAPSEAVLTSTARDAAQSLLNHLLNTCPITSTETSSTTSGVSMTLPPPQYLLPREKPPPVPKAPTKWEAFASKKGIGKFNKLRKAGQEGENRAGKMVYDEEKGEWVPKYGYKGANKKGEEEWLVEVDEKKERERLKEGKGLGGDPRTEKRKERVERIRRNERKTRANERRGRKGAAT
ncbi:MAG: Rhodanese- sulfurtransferase [Chrysothrix sp. TS-e1954]|nr:MAG: Rhodanese- sulfurtransferase [Chrysothrix sp. TS-e1954]